MIMIGKILGGVSAIFLDIIETLVIGVSLFLVIYLFFMQPHQVSGHSMEPTLMDKEYVLTDKVSYRTGSPRRGDIVVLHAPEAANCPTGTGCDFIKRVLGVPGETVEVKDNGIFINGTKLQESYIAGDVQTLAGKYTESRSIVLSADQYFVVGDNRMHSSDSRAWGPVSLDNIVGRAFFLYWPLNKAGVIHDPTY